jgi:hypothetical protein
MSMFKNFRISYKRKDLVLGCAIAEAVSRWLPAAAARVRARVWQVGFVVDKMAAGQVFSKYPVWTPPPTNN